MNQPGLFDYSKRLACIDNVGDPLAKLNEVIDWEQFRKLIDLSREKPRKSPAGAKVSLTALKEPPMTGLMEPLKSG